MEHIKKIFNNPKNTTIIACVINCLFFIITSISIIEALTTGWGIRNYILDFLLYGVLALYFGSVYLRLKGNNIKIKWKQIAMAIIVTIYAIKSIYNLFIYNSALIYIIGNLSIGVYFFILAIYLVGIFTKKKYIINKIFLIITIISIFGIFIGVETNNNIILLNLVINKMFRIFFILSITPYLYSYYNLLKEEKNNG